MLITIDDIDLNASLAFEMAEQIRKYLIIDKVVVCIAGKVNNCLMQFVNHIYACMSCYWNMVKSVLMRFLQ